MRRECDNCEVVEKIEYRIRWEDGLVWFACSKACERQLNGSNARTERVTDSTEQSDGGD